MNLKSLVKQIILIIGLILITNNIVLSQWKKCSGKYSDLSVKEIIKVQNKLFASTNEGIIISNNGVDWNEIIEFSFPINELYNFDNIVFGVFGYNALKVTFSRDKGETWEMLNTDTLNNFTRSLYSLLYDKGSIFLATGKGIYKTDDWGKEWYLVSNKIIGNHTGHTKILKVSENYFAIDKNRELFVSKDYGRSWSRCDTENINSRNIFNHNNNLYGLKDNKYLCKLNSQFKWEVYINKEFSYISIVKPFCCNGFFVSSDKNRIIFSENNIIELPKIPIPKNFDLLQEIFISTNYITVSFIDYGLWFIPYDMNVKFKN